MKTVKKRNGIINGGGSVEGRGQMEKKVRVTHGQENLEEMG